MVAFVTITFIKSLRQMIFRYKMKNGKLLPAAILVLFVIVFAYFILTRQQQTFTSTTSYLSWDQVLAGCLQNNSGGSPYTICCSEGGKVADCTNKQVFKCGEPITIFINFDKFSNVPSSYRMCLRKTFIAPQNSTLSNTKYYFYDSSTNMEFLCQDSIWDNISKHPFFFFGYVPSNSKSIVFFDAYAFPSSSSYNNIKDFENSLSAATKIGSASASVQCP